MDLFIKSSNGTTLQTEKKYCEENIVIRIDGSENISPENIKKDIKILGVTGTLEPSAGDTEELLEKIAKLEEENNQEKELLNLLNGEEV